MMHQRIVVDCGGTEVVALVNGRFCLRPGEKIAATFAVHASHVIAIP
jgi:hypothetical protein